MQSRSTLLILGLSLSIAACDTVDIATRNTPFEQIPTTETKIPAGYDAARDSVATRAVQDPAALAEAVESPYRVTRVIVEVPKDLRVSEANTYLPRGDIVWREDPIGDRHAQVRKIVQDALKRGTASLKGDRAVELHVEVKRFHALTEKARYTVGGVHAITFVMELRDAGTGEVIGTPKKVRADLDAFGGRQAILAEAKGQTQKVRISDHLAEVIRTELTDPDGYQGAATGFIQALNYL